MKVACRGDDGILETAAGSVADVEVVEEAAAEVLVTVGEGAFRSLAAEPPDGTAPVLPVAVDGAHAVPADALDEALRAVAAGGTEVHSHPVVGVAVGGEPAGRALLDVGLVTAEPAMISEYAVRVGDRRVDAVRADGVVVATPVGSGGYARAAGGPVLGPGTGLAVVPVAPYATATDTWVLDPPFSLTVERDDAPVSLVLDGREARSVAPDEPVRLAVDRELELVHGPGTAWADPR